MKKTILIAGGTGLTGKHFSEMLATTGYEVLHLSRKPDSKSPYKTFRWDPSQGYIDENALLKADAVVNLAGAGIMDKRWTQAYKKLVVNSRVESANVFAKYLKLDKHGIKTYVSASATGFYGDRGKEWLTEESGPGKGFLSDTCVQWENAAEQIQPLGIRVVRLRLGVVLSPKGGALKQLILPLHFFLSPYFASGKQFLSWLHIDDLSRMMLYVLENEKLASVYNAVAPNPLTNYGMARALAKTNLLPTFSPPVPAFLLRLAMGEMATTLTNSVRVSSEKIQKTGFEFLYPEIQPALTNLKKRG